MNQEKIGKFITECRKKQDLTQMELAKKLGVTTRAISNWENGISMPDYSLIESLSKILNVSSIELLCGEYIEEKDREEVLDINIIRYEKYLKKQKNKKNIYRIVVSFLIFIIGLIFMILAFNKTFFKTEYVSDFYDNVVISVPRFSYYRSTNGIDEHYVKLKTLRQPDDVNFRIKIYLNTLDSFYCNGEMYYYDPVNDFTISQYNINNDGIGFINTIYIRYHNQKYCEY